MVGKWTLQLLGTVLLINVGIYNYYKQIKFAKKSNNFKSSLKEITLMNDGKDMDFKEQLKVGKKFFENILNHYDCNQSTKSSKLEKLHFLKVLIEIRESAVDIYLFHRLFNYTVDYLIQSRIEETRDLMPLECYASQKRFKEIYENIHELLHLYFTNFPKNANSDKYRTCYAVSLMEFVPIENLSVTYFVMSSSNMNSLNIFVINSLQKIKKCIPLKSLRKNPSPKYNSKRISKTNSNSISYQLKEEDIKFKNHLEIVTKFFKTILNHYECSKSSKNVAYRKEEWKISLIINFISSSADENYSFHKNIGFDKISTTNSSEVSKLIPEKCEIQLEENKELIQNLYQFFKMFYENFPLEFIDDDYSKCFIKSVEIIKNININHYNYFFLKNTFGREWLIDIIRKNLLSIMKCVELIENL
ncbi:uncharacterized protein LOC122507196 [Leptopilina heterotoma]|uniref:uncharacterized protein LOC122507196 n=1 Tax=Leptopilina heterotoma TaxID=63436 RepID=UPI001CA7D5AE|nr:uncharacterized protein LOC122507196 [Leptopilina heterotoma]